MSAKIRNGTVITSNIKVSMYSISILLHLKVHCSPLRGGAVVGFTMDKGCTEHMLAKMRHAYFYI